MLERIGIVFFLSTTPCMSVSSFKKSPLRTVSSMGFPTSGKRKNSITFSSFRRLVEKPEKSKKGLKKGLEMTVGPERRVCGDLLPSRF
jgi:hypothetical protein